jgi:thiol-disulfide isomerase/thioredoxin
MNPRYLVLGAMAGVLGLGAAWIEETRSKNAEETKAANPAASAPAVARDPKSTGAQILQRLKTGQLPAPAGASSQLAAAKPLTVVNFWATWCPPCVEEIPELNALAAQGSFQQRATIAGIAIDNPSNVNEFLKKTPINYANGLAGLDGSEWMKALGNSAGGLPFTVILNAQGEVVFSKAGKTTLAELSLAVEKASQSGAAKP